MANRRLSMRKIKEILAPQISGLSPFWEIHNTELHKIKGSGKISAAFYFMTQKFNKFLPESCTRYCSEAQKALSYQGLTNGGILPPFPLALGAASLPDLVLPPLLAGSMLPVPG